MIRYIHKANVILYIGIVVNVSKVIWNTDWVICTKIKSKVEVVTIVIISARILFKMDAFSMKKINKGHIKRFIYKMDI